MSEPFVLPFDLQVKNMLHLCRIFILVESSRNLKIEDSRIPEANREERAISFISRFLPLDYYQSSKQAVF